MRFAACSRGGYETPRGKRKGSHLPTGAIRVSVEAKVGPILAKANRTKITNDLQAIVNASQQYYATTGIYPETIEDLVNPSTCCLGKDGSEGGDGDDEDIYYPRRDEF